MITHTIESYWIPSQKKPPPPPPPPPPSQKKTKSKLQIYRIRLNSKFLNFETNITQDTPPEIAW